MIRKIQKSYQWTWKNKQKLLSVMFSDLLFFLSFSAIFYILQPKLTKHFLAVSQLFAVTGMPTGTGPEGAKEFLSRFPVFSFYNEFILIAQLLLLLLGVTLLLWIFFQGFSWKKHTHCLAKKWITQLFVPDLLC
jgi:hypothetical protein